MIADEATLVAQGPGQAPFVRRHHVAVAAVTREISEVSGPCRRVLPYPQVPGVYDP